ncbi:MAG: lanthionine synthetase LanC family protein [Dysgonomonas sp.]
MYHSILNQIANTIFINIQHQENVGLLNGKTGTALFLYNYARYTNNEMYRELADELLDQIYENLNKHVDKSFFNGLAGIAYGVNYIIEKEFVEIDESDGDILEEIDSELSQINEESFLLELESDLPLFSKGLYFLQRKDKYPLPKIAEECFFFLTSHKQEIPLSYINSILYFANKGLSLDEVDKNISDKILEILYNQTYKILSEQTYNDSDIYTLQRNIGNILNVKIKEKWSELRLNYNNKELDLLEQSWIHFIYNYDNDETLSSNESELQELLKNIIQDLTHEDMNLYNGLVGLGLELIRLSKNSNLES